jgi:hypothetical protein
MEGSGSVQINYGSGSGRPKNILIRNVGYLNNISDHISGSLEDSELFIPDLSILMMWQDDITYLSGAAGLHR